MQLIGIEEHFLTPEIHRAWQSPGLTASDLEASGPGVALHAGKVTKRLMNLASERLALMGETGLDVQVLSLTTPALHDMGVDSIDLARRTNDALAEAVSRHPTRFQALATLPVSQPEAAALELEHCINELGFQGTMLCGRVGSRHLDDAAMLPILVQAASLGAPVLLHPRVPPLAVREAYYSGISPEVDVALAAYGLGWHYDAGLQFLRLVLAGTFDRLPRLQVILGHWGEMVLFYIERFAAMDRVASLSRPIADYCRANLYVTASGMFLPHYLARAAEVVGHERLLFSTDFPYQYREGGDARGFLQRCGLEGSAKAAFAHGNWQRLTKGAVVS